MIFAEAKAAAEKAQASKRRLTGFIKIKLDYLETPLLTDLRENLTNPCHQPILVMREKIPIPLPF